MWKQFWDGYPTVLSSEIGVMLDYNSTLGQRLGGKWEFSVLGASRSWLVRDLPARPDPVVLVELVTGSWLFIAETCKGFTHTTDAYTEVAEDTIAASLD